MCSLLSEIAHVCGQFFGSLTVFFDHCMNDSRRRRKLKTGKREMKLRDPVVDCLLEEGQLDGYLLIVAQPIDRIDVSLVSAWDSDCAISSCKR